MNISLDSFKSETLWIEFKTLDFVKNETKIQLLFQTFSMNVFQKIGDFWLISTARF